uniref:Protein kinase domain-containing protein n=1 Tax=Oryza punctata TaxID=4537 RepID=A0A0E0LDL9_ORYPU
MQQTAESCGNGLELAQWLNITINATHSITYLHEFKEQSIIHRNVRSSNMLRTHANGEDGRHRASELEDTQGKSATDHVDLEYLSTYELTTKSDAFSFGVLLVELVTGR